MSTKIIKKMMQTAEKTDTDYPLHSTEKNVMQSGDGIDTIPAMIDCRLKTYVKPGF